MVVILMTKSKNFKIIFKNKDNQLIDLNYKLHDSIVAEKWFKKIKHLKNIPFDEIESELINLENLKDIYKEFCNFSQILPLQFQSIDQPLLNKLHQIFEQNHEKLSKKRNNSIIYKFHHSIHYNESISHKKTKINVGWGIKEGPLTENFNCNANYENKIIKNNVYLPWTELGKKPLTYWQNKEPNDQARFNELVKPHITFRAKFFIAIEDSRPTPFSKEFKNWFETYKDEWLNYYDIKKWDHIDEHSAPLLAIADHKQNINNLSLFKIIT